MSPLTVGAAPADLAAAPAPRAGNPADVDAFAAELATAQGASDATAPVGNPATGTATAPNPALAPEEPTAISAAPATEISSLTRTAPDGVAPAPTATADGTATADSTPASEAHGTRKTPSDSELSASDAASILAATGAVPSPVVTSAAPSAHPAEAASTDTSPTVATPTSATAASLAPTTSLVDAPDRGAAPTPDRAAPRPPADESALAGDPAVPAPASSPVLPDTPVASGAPRAGARGRETSAAAPAAAAVTPSDAGVGLAVTPTESARPVVDSTSGSSPALSRAVASVADASTSATTLAYAVSPTSRLDAATPVAAPAPPSTPPAPAPPLHTQLAPTLLNLRSAGGGTHVITMTVAPEQLGPVTVRAHVAADGIRIELSAPTAQGRDALGAMLPELRRDLSQGGMNAGLSLASSNADGSGTGTGQQPWAGTGQWAGANASGGDPGAFARERTASAAVSDRAATDAEQSARPGSPLPRTGATTALDVFA